MLFYEIMSLAHETVQVDLKLWKQMVGFQKLKYGVSNGLEEGQFLFSKVQIQKLKSSCSCIERKQTFFAFCQKVAGCNHSFSFFTVLYDLIILPWNANSMLAPLSRIFKRAMCHVKK